MFRLYFFTCFVLYATVSHGQNIFRGIVLSRYDSTAMSNVAVQVKENGITLLTDDHGRFSIELNAQYKQITLVISAIGVRDTLIYKPPFGKQIYIYPDIAISELRDVAIKSLSAREVVELAVASIPQNYLDSSYFDYSFYRRYQRVNGRFVNLFEARPVIMFRLKTDKNIISKEAFAVTQLRRTRQYPNASNVIEDNPVDLLEINPIYHLKGSSLDPMRFGSYQFHFDTSGDWDNYVINYVCGTASTDHHGVPDYERRDLNGETWETGELVIDRNSFAIKRYHRISHKQKKYQYKWFPPQNNLVTFQNHTLCFDFRGGDLVAEYAQNNGKWFLKKIARQYSDDFYWPGFETLEFRITDNFEWYSDSQSRYTTGEYIDKFYPKMATAIHHYDSIYWQQVVFPFHYFTKEDVFTDLQKDGALTTQFYNETKVDERVSANPGRKNYRRIEKIISDTTGILSIRLPENKKP